MSIDEALELLNPSKGLFDLIEQYGTLDVVFEKQREAYILLSKCICECKRMMDDGK